MTDSTNNYIVYKIYRNSGKKIVLARNLSKDQAKRLVNSYPFSNKSMVVFQGSKND